MIPSINIQIQNSEYKLVPLPMSQLNENEEKIVVLENGDISLPKDQNNINKIIAVIVLKHEFENQQSRIREQEKDKKIEILMDYIGILMDDKGHKTKEIEILMDDKGRQAKKIEILSSEIEKLEEERNESQLRSVTKKIDKIYNSQKKQANIDTIILSSVGIVCPPVLLFSIPIAITNRIDLINIAKKDKEFLRNRITALKAENQNLSWNQCLEIAKQEQEEIKAEKQRQIDLLPDVDTDTWPGLDHD